MRARLASALIALSGLASLHTGCLIFGVTDCEQCGSSQPAQQPRDAGKAADGADGADAPRLPDVADIDSPAPCRPPRAGDECDLVTQDCSNGEAMCLFDADAGHSKCVVVPSGAGKPGDGCAARNDCNRGLFCLEGHCARACCAGVGTACEAGGECALTVTDKSGAAAFQACRYRPSCHPFAYDCPAGQVCLFAVEPDVFKCSVPKAGTALGTKPGAVCAWANQCGESQVCASSGLDAGGETMCRLFCWLVVPDAFSPGSSAGGRFPADGTCTIDGVSYGTCRSSPGIGGGLGICAKD